MFYFPCEQTTKIQDTLTGALIGLARATEGNDHMVSDSTAAVVVEGLYATLTNSDNDALNALLDRADMEKRKLVPMCYECASSCGKNNNFDMQKLWTAEESIRSLKSLILFGIRSIAAYAHHAAVLGYRDDAIHQFLYKGLFAIGMEDWGTEELLPILLEMGEVNLKCMNLLNQAYTKTNSHP